MKSICKKCISFFSIKKSFTFNKDSETESKCLVSGETISEGTIITECRHKKEIVKDVIEKVAIAPEY